MKCRLRHCLLGLCLWAGSACAATHYVVTANPGAAMPFTNWATAGTNVVEVVAVALTNAAAREVIISNGVYRLTNSIVITNAMTIRGLNGYTNTILTPDALFTGRAFLVQAHNVTISGVSVTNFLVDATDGEGYKNGAAIYIYARDNVSVSNCLFDGNRSVNSDSRGGAIWQQNYRYSSSRFTTRITDCIFRKNKAYRAGGAIAIFGTNRQRVILAGCHFESNSVTANNDYAGPGAVEFSQLAEALVSNCVFAGNEGCFYGGGLGISFSDEATSNSLDSIGLVVNSQFMGNRSRHRNPNSGGGLYLNAAAPIREAAIRNCSFVSNRVYDWTFTATPAYDYRGGGLYVSGSTGAEHIVVESCTIAGNGSANRGGGIYVGRGNVEVRNCVIWTNVALVESNNWYLAAAATNVVFSHNCTTPLTGLTGSGNIETDPMFENLAAGDPRLQINSPCVNRGINQAWMDGAFDLGGHRRVLHLVTDMGAYETLLQGTMFVFQ